MLEIFNKTLIITQLVFSYYTFVFSAMNRWMSWWYYYSLPGLLHSLTVTRYLVQTSRFSITSTLWTCMFLLFLVLRNSVVVLINSWYCPQIFQLSNNATFLFKKRDSKLSSMRVMGQSYLVTNFTIFKEFLSMKLQVPTSMLICFRCNSNYYRQKRSSIQIEKIKNVWHTW